MGNNQEFKFRNRHNVRKGKYDVTHGEVETAMKEFKKRGGDIKKLKSDFVNCENIYEKWLDNRTEFPKGLM
jgi:hypothetical protein